MPAAGSKDTDADSNGSPDTNDASDEECDATEPAHEECDATEPAHGEPPAKKRRKQPTVVRDEQPGDATERSDDSDDDCNEAFPAAITGNDAANTVKDATGRTQMFTKSLQHRDDWLHRGIMLRDMDYYHYARYIERVEMPRSGTAESLSLIHI